MKVRAFFFSSLSIFIPERIKRKLFSGVNNLSGFIYFLVQDKGVARSFLFRV